jgi:polar amino acid transport system substrate-binding protein
MFRVYSIKNLCVLLLLVSTQINAETVTIRSDSWFPINGTPGDELPGFQIELAQRTFESIDYRLMPWGRAVEQVGAGKFDCVVGAYIDDTPGFVLPTENWGIVVA